MSDTTDPIRVLVTLDLPDDLLESFRLVSDRIDLIVHPAQQVRDVPDDVWSTVEVLYTWNVIPDPALAPKLRWVHVNSAGVDNITDQPVFQAGGVMLTTSSGTHAPNMAEYIFMMMLAFGHRLPAMLRYQHESTWAGQDDHPDFMPLELRGSTLGIVGYGSIGREVAHLAHTFGMEVLAVKRDVRQPAESGEYAIGGTGDPGGTFFHRLYPPEALVSMVRECDFVVLTVPLTDSTRLMFDENAINAMKPTAFLINVSRGGVVDEDALLEALQENRIGGVATDVFEAEPLPEDSPFWKLPNIIISPHVSGMSPHYAQKAADLFIENLKRYVARKDLLNVVDHARGY